MRRAALAALAASAAQGAYAAALRFMLRRAVARFVAGDVDAYLRFFADDATLSFPGDSSWGRVYRGRDEIRGFLERFLATGLRGEIQGILVAGPPWDTTVAVRFVPHGRAPDGTLFYENDAMVVVKARWGKVLSEEVFEDTQKTAELDRYLERTERVGAAA